MINKVEHLAYILKVPVGELEQIADEPDRHYYQKRQPKRHIHGTIRRDKQGNPVFRTLYPSVGRLKQIQQRINKNILQRLDLPDYVHGATIGKDNVTNARTHQGKKFIFSTDLKKFFPSVSHRAVFAMFRNHDFSPTVARRLTQLTTYKGQIPQGAPTSPTLANLVFADRAKALESFCSARNLTFTTFIDDLTFSGAKDFQEHHSAIIDFIRNAGFRISYAKTNYRTKHPMVTGIIVLNNGLALPLTFRLKMAKEQDPQKHQALQQYAKKVENVNARK